MSNFDESIETIRHQIDRIKVISEIMLDADMVHTSKKLKEWITTIEEEIYLLEDIFTHKETE